jgi:2-methylisocitrate lyase-like PEP mutase family enzyme
VPTQSDLADRFLELHLPGTPLLMPNAWDAGSAKVLEHLGFEAIATTSSGFAASRGGLDGSVTLEEVLAHATALTQAVSIPVSADFENGFADDPQGVAQNVDRAVATGLAGCSIEDFARSEEKPIYDLSLATERVAAAAEAAHRSDVHLALTGRAENFVHGNPDLDDTIVRLRAYADAGADAVFAPGVQSAEGIRAIVEAVDVPVNVLALPGTPTVRELASIGVARVSVGGALAFAALGALVEAAEELRERGTYDYWSLAGPGSQAARAAFGAGE